MGADVPNLKEVTAKLAAITFCRHTDSHRRSDRSSSGDAIIIRVKIPQRPACPAIAAPAWAPLTAGWEKYGRFPQLFLSIMLDCPSIQARSGTEALEC